MRKTLILVLAMALPQVAYAQGVSAERILLGQAAVFSGPAAQLGIQMNRGAKLFFDNLNAAGGVHGAQIELRTMDDMYEPDKCKANTEALITNPPGILVATTGIGFRGWIAAADGWGLASELTHALSQARIVSRGPKATGALRAAGLPEVWSPESESSREVLHYLVEHGIYGLRIAVQLHGATDEWDPFPEFLDELRSAGADVARCRLGPGDRLRHPCLENPCMEKGVRTADAIRTPLRHSGADLEASEVAHREARVAQHLGDRDLVVLRVRLLEQCDLLEVGAEATLDDLRKSGFGLALLAF